MKKIFLLGTTVLLFTSLSFAQTGKDGKGNATDSTKKHTTTMKPCPGKTCGKKKG
jgi:hypothetical protein